MDREIVDHAETAKEALVILNAISSTINHAYVEIYELNSRTAGDLLFKPWLEAYSLANKHCQALQILSSKVEIVTRGLPEDENRRALKILSWFAKTNKPPEIVIEDSQQLTRQGNDAERPKRRPKSKRTIKDCFSCGEGQVFFDGKDLHLPAGQAVDVMRLLVGNFGHIVPYKNLDQNSYDKTSDQLRGIIFKINKVLKTNKIPCSIVSKRGTGYYLALTND